MCETEAREIQLLALEKQMHTGEEVHKSRQLHVLVHMSVLNQSVN